MHRDAAGCTGVAIQVQYKYWDWNTMRCIEMQPGVLGLQYKYNTSTGIGIQCDASRCSRVYWGCNTSTIQVLGLEYNAMHRDAAGCTGVAIQVQYKYWDWNTMRCIEMQPGVLGLQYKYNTSTGIGIQCDASRCSRVYWGCN